METPDDSTLMWKSASTSATITTNPPPAPSSSTIETSKVDESRPSSAGNGDSSGNTWELSIRVTHSGPPAVTENNTAARDVSASPEDNAAQDSSSGRSDGKSPHGIPRHRDAGEEYPVITASGSPSHPGLPSFLAPTCQTSSSAPNDDGDDDDDDDNNNNNNNNNTKRDGSTNNRNQSPERLASNDDLEKPATSPETASGNEDKEGETLTITRADGKNPIDDDEEDAGVASAPASTRGSKRKTRSKSIPTGTITKASKSAHKKRRLSVSSTTVSGGNQEPPQPPPSPPPEVFYHHLEFPKPESLLPSDSDGEDDSDYYRKEPWKKGSILWRRRKSILKQLAKDPDETLSPGARQVPKEICGIQVQVKQTQVCGKCLSAKEEAGNSILLCDGPGCGQEFHMKCCIPPVSTVPKGKFYCFDCSPTGATQQLKDYFKEHAARKEEHERQWINQPLSTKGKKKKGQYFSFVDTLLQEDVVAESEETDPITGSLIKSKKPKSKSRAQQEPDIMLPVSELESFDHGHWVGKVVRLYCPNGNVYHTGRILDTQTVEDTTTSTVIHRTTALVKFPAGKEYRKQDLVEWMILEEHCLAVESDLVWARMQKQQPQKQSSNAKTAWVRAKVWRRSARELVPVMKLLDEEQGSIRFRKLQAIGEEETDMDETKAEPVITKPRFALVESFGNGMFELLEVENETAQEPPKSSGKLLQDPIIEGLVAVEKAEQDRVRNWNQLPLRNPFLASAKTIDAPGTLEFETPLQKQYIRPTALVDQGLDRQMIMELVSQELGVETTKDLGLSLICERVESLPHMIQNMTS